VNSIIMLLLTTITISSAITPPDTIPNDVFLPGEKLKYLMYYGFLEGGTGTLSIKERKWKGKQVYFAQVLAKTSGMVDRIYHVRELYESYFDIHTGLPYRAIRDVVEDEYVQYNEVQFDRKNNLATSSISGQHKVPDNILDLVSVFYYLRRVHFKNIKQGDVIEAKVFFLDEIYPLRIRYKGTETIKTKIGKIDCLRFKPVVEPGRAFDTEDDVTIWISNDKNLIPVRLQMDLFVGSFKADLIEYEGLKYELKINK